MYSVHGHWLESKSSKAVCNLSIVESEVQASHESVCHLKSWFSTAGTASLRLNCIRVRSREDVRWNVRVDRSCAGTIAAEDVASISLGSLVTISSVKASTKLRVCHRCLPIVVDKPADR